MSDPAIQGGNSFTSSASQSNSGVDGDDAPSFDLTGTTTERIARSITTGEKLSDNAQGQSVNHELTNLSLPEGSNVQSEPILLAQSAEIFPPLIQQRMQQQLKPVENTLNDVLTTEPGQAALDLITEHRDTIIAEATSAGVDPQHVASIIFQEKLHGGWADAKNAVFAWPQVYAGANNATIGLAEMDINTAARIMGINTIGMTTDQRNQIIETLSDDKSAIGLIAGNIASFETRLGRNVTLKEATFGHNAGIDALVRDLPIVIGTEKSIRSWDHQDAISAALD